MAACCVWDGVTFRADGISPVPDCSGVGVPDSEGGVWVPACVSDDLSAIDLDVACYEYDPDSFAADCPDGPRPACLYVQPWRR